MIARAVSEVFVSRHPYRLCDALAGWGGTPWLVRWATVDGDERCPGRRGDEPRSVLVWN